MSVALMQFQNDPSLIVREVDYPTYQKARWTDKKTDMSKT